ncbi:MAG: PQQ-like beta-propeller repeat protein [Bacteroidia bacterium]|nr:PQQ-like beta-propeller repeat protein [Bacteroidia bacterium]
MDSVWKTEIRDYSISPMLNSKGDLITSKIFSDPNGEIFQLYDGLTGKLKWEWQDFFAVERGFDGNDHFLYKDVLAISTRNTTYAIDAITGKTLWRDYQDTLYGDNFLTGDEDGFIYHGFRPFDVGNRLVYIWRTRYDVLNWEPVCQYLEPLELERIRTSNMVVTKNHLGEKILVYTLSIFRVIDGSRKETSKIIAYNLNTNKVMWEVDNTTNDISLTYWKTNLLSKDNKIFIFGEIGQSYALLAYDLMTGNRIWFRPIPDYGVGLYLYKDKIIPLINRHKVVEAMDINTGVTQWVKSYENDLNYDISFGFNDSKVYKNYLISTQCSKMLAINLDNGKEVYYDAPKVMGECLQFGIAINEEKRWFYVQDRKYINCYTLPSQIK